MRWLLLVGLTAALFVPGVGHGANLPHPRLDQVASEIAGKPATVHCESSEDEWNNGWAQLGMVGWQLWGVSHNDTSEVVLSPRVCHTLRVALDHDHVAAGPYMMSRALHTLVHESVHQRGIADEAVTECLTMPLIKGVAVRHFGYKRQKVVTRLVKKIKVVTVRFGKQIRRVRVPTMVERRTTAPNPELQALLAWVDGWHLSLPPEYHKGAC